MEEKTNCISISNVTENNVFHNKYYETATMYEIMSHRL